GTLRIRLGDTLRVASRGHPAARAVWLGHRGDPLSLYQRERSQHRQEASLRRRDSQPGTTLARNGFQRGSRGTRQTTSHTGLPRLPRLASAYRGTPRSFGRRAGGTGAPRPADLRGGGTLAAELSGMV